MRKIIARVLTGLSMLPTATKLNVREPLKSSGYAPGQFTYILLSTNPEDLKGGPQVVAVTSFEPLTWGETILNVGDDILTKHFSDKKNLPSRRVIGVKTPEGSVHGEVPVGSMPHWEFMGGSVTADDVQARIDSQTAARNAPKATATKSA